VSNGATLGRRRVVFVVKASLGVEYAQYGPRTVMAALALGRRKETCDCDI